MSELDMVDKVALTDAIDHVNNVIKDAKTVRVAAERLERDARCALNKLLSIKRRVREADEAREKTDAQHRELSKLQYPAADLDSQVPGG